MELLLATLWILLCVEVFAHSQSGEWTLLRLVRRAVPKCCPASGLVRRGLLGRVYWAIRLSRKMPWRERAALLKRALA